MIYDVRDRGDDLSRQLAERFHLSAQRYGFVHDEVAPEIIVSIGGDGTMLHAIHQHIDHLDSIAFVGVHTGHLGFYADWQSNEIEELIALMAANPLSSTIVKYPMAEFDVTTSTQTTAYLACNEFTIRGIDATLVAKLHVNDEPFETFRGDGIVISTPTGSTAYNKSLGGAIIHPALPSIQISEIASINNRVYRTLGSSMILPKHHYCDIYPRSGQTIRFAVDHLQINLQDITSIRCKVSEQTVSFARYRPFPFWNRVRDAFVGKAQE